MFTSTLYREFSIALTPSSGFGLCDDESLHMETRDLRCALTQPYGSTSRAFTVSVRLWSPSEKVLVRFSFLLNDVLIQSASQKRRRREISMREIERVFHDRIISRDLWPVRSPDMTLCDFCLWDRLKNVV